MLHFLVFIIAQQVKLTSCVMIRGLKIFGGMTGALGPEGGYIPGCGAVG